MRARSGVGQTAEFCDTYEIGNKLNIDETRPKEYAMANMTKFESFVRQDVSLSGITGFHLGGAAEYLAGPNSRDELAALVRHCRSEKIPMRVLGRGSNVLVREEGVPGVVIQLSAPAFTEISVDGHILTAGGGALLQQVISMAVREGLAGLEQLVGVPGTIGAAMHGNAGTHGGDVGQWTHAATVMTKSGEIIEHQADDIQFAYRQSSLDELVILETQFKLEQEDADELTRRMQKLWIVTKAKQPMSEQRTGCIFKNPRGMSAESLIEQVGMKGARVGEAEVSDRHPNFIVANEGTVSQDVIRLIELVRDRVADRLGIELEQEIEIW
jgi:UDP-N-acetylmuramate dehydrogenase